MHGFLRLTSPSPPAIALLLTFLCFAAKAQPAAPNPSPPERTTLPSGIDRLAGTEPASHIHYARLVLKGALHTTLLPAEQPPAAFPPALIAQCSLRPTGKYVFEMFTSFGGDTDLTFYPPWVPASREDLFPPRTEKVVITMEFLGYTHVKPIRRQWEVPAQAPGQYRFNSPGVGSANMEDISYDLRYLVALPTLRLSLGNHSAEFLTTPLLEAIRKELLCRAAAL
jgi:hypothetical protein